MLDLKEELYSCIETVCIKRDDAEDRNTYDLLVAPLFAKCIANISGREYSVNQIKIVVYAIHRVCKLYDTKMQFRVAMMLIGDLDDLDIEHLMIRPEFRRDRDNFARAYKIISEHENYNKLCNMITQELEELETSRMERTRKMNL
ncbi:hypothetical protein UT300012_24270 [Paraclostridium bifermentans]